MGNCCYRDEKTEPDTLPKEPLVNHVRYKTLGLPLDKIERICVFDLQEKNIQILKPEFPIRLRDFSYIFVFPIVYVAGGVDGERREVTERVWTSSPNEDVITMGERAPMNMKRRKPYLLYPTQGYIYAVSGYYHPDDNNSVLTACEKFDYANDRWETIDSLRYKPEAVYCVGDYIYAFGGIGNMEKFERLCTILGDKYDSWEEFQMTSSLKGINRISKYGVTFADLTQNRLLIFGGTFLGSQESDKIYSLHIASGALKEESISLPENAAITECYSVSPNLSFFVTKKMKLYGYSRKEGKWYLEDTKIASEAKAKGIELKL